MTAPATSVATVDESPILARLDGSRARTAPPFRSPIIEDYILGELSAGVTLAHICREIGIARATVYLWRDGDEDFAARFAKARSAGFDAIAERTLEIVDDRGIEPKRARNMAEFRLKLLAAWSSGTYANNVKVQSDVRSLVVELSADPVEAARQYQELMGN